MTRAEIIKAIEETFPADSNYFATADIGRRLLEQAKHDCDDWRALPDHVLKRYAELCAEQSRMLDAYASRNGEHGI